MVGLTGHGLTNTFKASKVIRSSSPYILFIFFSTHRQNPLRNLKKCDKLLVSVTTFQFSQDLTVEWPVEALSRRLWYQSVRV